MLKNDEVVLETVVGSSSPAGPSAPAGASSPAGPRAGFEAFVRQTEPRLRRPLVALYGNELGRDATAEALAYAWEHWDRLAPIDNLAGYLFRVAQSKSRRRRTPAVFVVPDRPFPTPAEHAFEPRLGAVLRSLPENQRLAVVLVHGFGWRITEVAELIGVKPTTVQNHLERGMRRLRKHLGADHDEA